MKINKEKLRRQELVIRRWKEKGAKGSLEAVTGFGKTYVAILVIQEMNKIRPDRTALVIVPSIYLASQWKEHIKTHKLSNVSVKVVNTAIKEPAKVDLLVLDEVHNYVSSKFRSLFRVIKYKFILGLTATMERLDNRHILLEHYCPIIDRVDMKEARENNYVSSFVVVNFGIEFSPEEAAEYKKVGNTFNSFFAQFGHDFNMAMSCLTNDSQRAQYAKYLGKTPSEVKTMAVIWSRAMQKRKQLIYNCPSKIKVATEILLRFPMPTLTFSESVDFADRLTAELSSVSRSYNSKMKKKEKTQALEDYADEHSPVRIINTARALDEGFDVPGTEMALICSGSSSARQDVQRTGRAIRYMQGKLGVIVNLYIKDSQEVKWLRARQKKTQNIVSVDSLDEMEQIINQQKAVV